MDSIIVYGKIVAIGKSVSVFISTILTRVSSRFRGKKVTITIIALLRRVSKPLSQTKKGISLVQSNLHMGYGLYTYIFC